MEATTLHKSDPSLVHAKVRYQDENVAASYDEVRFTRPIGRVIDALEKRAFRRALRHVRGIMPQPSVLDIPCGTGRITELLLAQGLTVLGGDISEPMIEIARGKLAPLGHQIAFRRLDVDNLDLPDRSFDVITCIRLLNHLMPRERARALHEMSRVSRRFVIANVSFVSPLYRVASRLKSTFGIVQPKEPWTWHELHEQGSDAGLRIRDYFHELPLLSEVLVVLFEKLEPNYRSEET
jgi:ubiquinone/menaquinone biosynthesis C-methylase UbiE